MKEFTKTIKNKTREQKGGFLGILLGTLGASLLGNMLAGKGIVRTGYGNKKRKGVARTGYGNKMDSYTASSFNKPWDTEVLSE